MNTYVRILRYVKPYLAHLIVSILCVLLFVVFSSISLFSIMPFLSTLFGTEPVVSEQVISQTDDAASDVDSRVNYFERQFEAMKSRAYDVFLGQDWQENKEKSLQRLCVMLMVIIFMRGLFGYFQAYFMAHVEQGVIKDIRNDIYRHLNALSLSYFHSTSTGKLISRITNDVTLINSGISASFFTLVKNPLLVLVYIVLAFTLSWQLSLIAFFILPLSLGIISWIGLRLRKTSAISQERMADVTSILQETIAGARIVKAFGMEQFEMRKFEEKTQAFFRTLLKLTRTRNLASPLTEFLGTMVAVGILWFGGYKVLQDTSFLAPEEFIWFLLIIFSVMQPVKELSSVNNRIQEALAAGERVFRLMDTEPDVQNRPGARPIEVFENSVKFDNVSFHYQAGTPVLEDVYLEVPKGNILAIVGPSGAGKSTLMDLLPRFYDPIAGSIQIDGQDLRDIKMQDLRRLLGIVTQETILFNDTVRANIAYGLSDIPVSRIEHVAKSANAHRFIQEMEDGYDTVIGERGVKLSGGERQRLAIARALLKDPPILILDEATSSLDTESEMLVQEAIDRLMENRTSFVIAHRLSTVQHADQIIVLDQGRIVETGKHTELLKQGGLYKRLHKMQFRNES